ncbi:pentatricopeptide repeat-containing protein At5g04780, mitochondrial isoform X2 [Malania oleifera]|uniref:pentatricopeptide repeat-containing protein At5g04780, mitochondrial isoform X2 n=1 Tax=Malania oleifera TaxID=397392 RepID=UPI0025ADBDED|nr:pentatricopeptide repeat-containing protein At5g04780, mitochondrial isoform X2 [Malania oleifera]XP_057978865.1 pentatricopeptide repeat-containing protein At5g04780, mitochondrial isoform X2 [Malania oleifera]
MNILRKQKRIFDSIVLHVRYLSCIPNAKPDTSSLEEHVRVAAGVFRVSNLQGLLQKCARERAIIEGKACHGQAIRVGLEKDTLTSNMLVNMYSKCGIVGSARQVFDEMPERSIVSWNTMIGSYTQNWNEQEALNLLMQMQREGAHFCEFTISSVLCACAAKCAVVECKQLHAFALKTAMESNAFVGTALLDVYAKCKLMRDARWVFECMPERSAITWSSMVAGYVQNELYEEALVLFHKVQMMGLEHNQFTISSTLAACSGLAALIEGKQVQRRGTWFYGMQ